MRTMRVFKAQFNFYTPAQETVDDHPTTSSFSYADSVPGH